MTEQIQLVQVRAPYPGTAPALRELEIRNRSAYSVLQITVGWLEGSSARQCPAARGAYRGTRDLFASLRPGESATLTGEFSEAAGYFCVVAAQFLPPPRQRQQPRAEPPAAAAAPQQPVAPPEDAGPPEVTVPPESEPTPEPAPTQ